MNAALCPGTWGIGTPKSERWSHYHALYCPDAACAPSLLLFFPFHIHSVLLSCPSALWPQAKRKSSARIWGGNKEGAQEEEESDGVVLSGKPGRGSS